MLSVDKIHILRDIASKKTGGLVVEKKLGDCIALIHKHNQIRFINQNESSSVEAIDVFNQEYTIEPFIPIIGQQRFCSVISGDAGNGKSLMGSLQIKQYIKLFPENKIYFVSQASYKDDPNLKDLPLNQLDSATIDENEITNFKECLILFDDNDFSSDVKKVMNIVNKAVEVGRKLGLSIIFITHINSKLNTSIIYRDFNMYTTFFSNLDNNRMLNVNLKISKEIIEELKEKKPAYISFNKNYRTVITDTEIFKY